MPKHIVGDQEAFPKLVNVMCIARSANSLGEKPSSKPSASPTALTQCPVHVEFPVHISDRLDILKMIK